MRYFTFGKTGIDVSTLGFGTMRLPEIQEGDEYRVDDELATPLIRSAVEKGINYFDCAWGYCHGDAQRALGAALKGRRNKVHISTKLPLWNFEEPKQFWEYLEGALKKLDTDYIDFYHLHALNSELWEKSKRLDIPKNLEKAKEQGLIRHISFSFHDRPEVMERLAETGLFESVLCQYNLIDRTNEKAMDYVRSLGLGVATMGPLGGGNIVAGGDELLEKFGSSAKSICALAFSFVFGNPSVCCVLSGMRNMQELDDNIQRTLEYSSFENWESMCSKNESLQKLADLYCTGCGYCEVCPEKIIPARVFDAYTRHKVWNLDKSALSRAREISESGVTPDACVKCGKCAARCPQKIDIPKKLELAWSELKRAMESENA